MVERGTVVGINGGDVDVMFKRTSACGKCCACGMMVGSDEMTIPLKNTIGATMGDKVIVEFSGKKISQKFGHRLCVPACVFRSRNFAGI